jgi:hypothetical protein
MCVTAALTDLVQKNVITNAERDRLRDSALKAYTDSH